MTTQEEIRDPADGVAANDDEIRAEFVRLISFVAAAKAPNSMKEDALDAIQALQSRLLP